ncbi:hypothetical protein ACTMTI_15185 [Nonomuraea sp. H19]|uniref:hypothetical protein n=1 Tax=Nonomuraea sp. H19 TaxID=3452206 RepID=UPI003F8CC87A
MPEVVAPVLMARVAGDRARAIAARPGDARCRVGRWDPVPAAACAVLAPLNAPFEPVVPIPPLGGAPAWTIAVVTARDDAPSGPPVFAGRWYGASPGTAALIGPRDRTPSGTAAFIGPRDRTPPGTVVFVVPLRGTPPAAAVPVAAPQAVVLTAWPPARSRVLVSARAGPFVPRPAAPALVPGTRAIGVIPARSVGAPLTAAFVVVRVPRWPAPEGVVAAERQVERVGRGFARLARRIVRLVGRRRAARTLGTGRAPLAPWPPGSSRRTSSGAGPSLRAGAACAAAGTLSPAA